MATVGYNIPLDLTIEILLRLPAKSLFRFRCVSKTWCFIIRSRQFADAYMSLSPSRPRLLLAFNHRDDNRLFFFSSSDHQSLSFSSSSSMVAAKDNTLTMPRIKIGDRIVQSNSVRGFVCCSLRRRFVVCNPTTRQVISLPEKPGFSESFDHNVYLYLGYDPSNDQYKVLRLEMKASSEEAIEHSVCTLGGQQSSYSWRRVKSGFLYYNCAYNGVCIDGAVYHDACLEPCDKGRTVSCFDVGSEQLRVIKTPQGYTGGVLTNYLGKFAVFYTPNDGCFILWVLDDVKNHVWSKRTCVYSSFSRSLFWNLRMQFAGVTASGEILYVPLWFSHPFEIFCYNVEKKVEKIIRVEGLAGHIYDACITSKNRCFASVSSCYVDNIFFL